MAIKLPKKEESSKVNEIEIEIEAFTENFDSSKTRKQLDPMANRTKRLTVLCNDFDKSYFEKISQHSKKKFSPLVREALYEFGAKLGIDPE